MQRYQFKYSQAVHILFGIILAINLSLPMPVKAAAVSNPLDFATVPLSNSPTIKIQPNLLFVLDDSGSMGWNYLPDWANDSLCRNTTAGDFDLDCENQPPFRSSDFNAIYYNPTITYTPAVNASGGKVNTSGDSKGSQTIWTSVKNDAYNIQDTNSTNLLTGYTDVEWCTSSAYTDCLRNDNYILPGIVNGKTYDKARSGVKATGTGTVATGSLLAPTTASRSYGPHYYNITPGEYCDSAKLTNCQLTETATFKYPAKVRWCKATSSPTVSAEDNSKSLNPAAGVCQATRVGGYSAARYPTKFFQPATAAVPAVPGSPEVLRVYPTGLITFGGTSTNASAYISRSLSNPKKTTIAVDTIKAATDNPLNIGNNRTPVQVASSVVSAIKTTGTIKAYIGGNTVTPTCASKSTNVVCLVDTSTTVTNGKVITVGTTNNFGGVTMSTTPTAGGVAYVAAVLPQDAIPAKAANYPGSFTRVDIVTGISYPKAITRTDCTGATGPTGCSYAEEMTNFANWWTYYPVSYTHLDVYKRQLLC